MAGSTPGWDRGGISSGERQRPPATPFPELPPPIPDPPANDAKLLCEGLGVLRSPGSAECAGLPQRASKEMVRMGLGDLAKWCGNAGSLGRELRPSGPKVLICGEDPR